MLGSLVTIHCYAQAHQVLILYSHMAQSHEVPNGEDAHIIREFFWKTVAH
jgi:hypothetical protein